MAGTKRNARGNIHRHLLVLMHKYGKTMTQARAMLERCSHGCRLDDAGNPYYTIAGGGMLVNPTDMARKDNAGAVL
jgi:hypothetical protein